MSERYRQEISQSFFDRALKTVIGAGIDSATHLLEPQEPSSSVWKTANTIANEAFGDDSDMLSIQNEKEIGATVNTAFGNDKQKEILKLGLEWRYITETGDTSRLEMFEAHQQEFFRQFSQNRTEEDI